MIPSPRTIPNHWTPRPYQLPIWAALERGIRYVLVVAHRRFGKDDLGLHWTAVAATQRAANYFYMLPEAEHVRTAIWTALNPGTGARRMDEAFPEWWRNGPLLDQEMTVRAQSGARIKFMGSDNYNSIVGSGPVGLIFSEWALADPQAFALLRPIIVQAKGWCLFLTTPRGKNHVWGMLQEFAKDDECAAFVIPASQTDVYTAEELAKEHSALVALYGPEVGGSLYRQEYECAFEDVVPGSLYADLIEAADKDGRIVDLAVDLGEPVHVAWDLGYSDAMALWYAQVRPSGWVDLIGYEEYRKKSIPDMIHILRAHPYNYGNMLLPHDADQHHVTANLTSRDLLTRAGFLCQVAPRTDDFVQVQSVRMLLPRCTFSQTDTERGVTCLKAFHVKEMKDKRDWSMKAVHDWASHGAKSFAALAHFAPMLRGGAKNKPVVTLTDGDRPIYEGRTNLGWMR